MGCVTFLQDGRLLTPTSSAVSIDKSLVQRALGGSRGPVGEVWSASTQASTRVFVYVFAADLEQDWTVRPADIGLVDSGQYRVFESDAPSVVYDFSIETPLLLRVSI
jgi:hypothetical protein